jgi:predicted nucleotidyltransferase
MERTEQTSLEELIRANTDFPWTDSLIHVFHSGSAAHGATGNKPTDTDISGVYIQPVEMVLGIPQMKVDEEGNRKVFDPDVHVWSSSGDNKRNTADDLDVNLFSLRKWTNMVATGNSNAIEFLFIPSLAHNSKRRRGIWEDYILANKATFISQRAGFHFTEFSKGMLKRIKGEGQGKHGQRPELEAEFGYDVKAAMHLLRVLGEGIELMMTGEIRLPRPEAPFLRDVRNGKFSLEEIEDIADARFELLAREQVGSFLPVELDRSKISKIITEAQIEFWGW